MPLSTLPTGYLTLNPAEFEAIGRLIDPKEVASIQFSRRDSLDNLCDSGFLIVSVVVRTGEQWRVAINETGSIAVWGES